VPVWINTSVFFPWHRTYKLGTCARPSQSVIGALAATPNPVRVDPSMVDAVPARTCHFDGGPALVAGRGSAAAPVDAFAVGGDVDDEGLAAVGVGVVVVGVRVEPIRAITKRQLPANPHTATMATTAVINFFMVVHRHARRADQSAEH
jgi:hypothetical protein